MKNILTSKEKIIENALNIIEIGVKNKSRHDIQNGFDIIDNIVQIEWEELPKLASRYNLLVELAYKI